MANKEHLAILKQALDKKDIYIWNNWRRKNSIIRADLRGANLNEANLRRADLNEADLNLADLSNADLSGADLREANLRGAYLIEAHLNGANLSGAYLINAHLNETLLVGANLVEADLSWADFENANCAYTTFANVNLSQTLNLDKVKHEGPSTIGIDTLYKSKGNIPREFLEGCGVPETMITFAKSLVGTAIEFYSCFISYNSQNEDFCEQLVARMKNKDLRVWYAPDDIKAGKKIHEQVYEAIRYHDKLIVVLSEHSMNSNWVETEIRRARKRERDEGRRVLFPIRLVDYESLQDWQLFDADEGRDLAQEIREYFIPDFQNWKDYDQFTIAFDRLLADLQKDE